MKNILIHGLGQNSESWQAVRQYLNGTDIDADCPDLFKSYPQAITYDALAKAFAEDCQGYNEKVNLCGLSLGGILALDYVKAYPEKVNSVILIGTPYEIPKRLFKLQGFIFKLMPESTFRKMGSNKHDFISLVNSMGSLDIRKDLNKISCPVLILCGEKDSANRKSALKLHELIKDSQFKLIQNAGHEVNTDNPEELAKAIISFWKQID